MTVTGTAEWLNSLPNKLCPERNQKIIEAVNNELVTFEWSEITTSYKNHKGTFYVLSDAAYIILDEDVPFKGSKGESLILSSGSRYRIPVDAKLQQAVADIIDASMITSKIMDTSYNQAQVKFDCVTLPACAQMDTINYSKMYSYKFEQQRKDREGLVVPAKTWILSNKLKISAGAVNHGFYTSSSSVSKNVYGMRMWQTEGTRHNTFHSDYSQLINLMKKACIVDDQEMQLEDVFKDPVLSYLINYDGILRYTRQP